MCSSWRCRPRGHQVLSSDHQGIPRCLHRKEEHMISRRQYLYHSILNAVVVALALCLGMVLVLTRCTGPQGVEQPSGSAGAPGTACRRAQLSQPEEESVKPTPPISNSPDFNKGLPEGCEWFSISFLARLWSCSKNTVQRLVDQGDLEVALDLAPRNSKHAMI